MYGALEKNPQDDPDRRQQTSGDPASNYERLTASLESKRKKRIYSHCHVQSSDVQKVDIDKSARRRLIVASVICLCFMIVEVVGGVLSNSLAIATDAAHLLTDFASFMISLFAMWVSSRPASRKMSFGWYRAEVIGALFSVLMIWLVTGLLVYMAIERLRTQDFEIDSLVMVITATCGLVVNIIMAIALNVDGHSHGFHSHGHGHSHSHKHNHNHHHHHEEGCEQDHIETKVASFQAANSSIELKKQQEANERLSEESASASNQNHEHNKKTQIKKLDEKGRGKSNINVRAALIHVIGDFLQSLGVLIAALVIHFQPEYGIVDPICTFVFSIIVLVTTINIIKDAINVLMEGIPDGINFIEVRERLQELRGVIRVHNLRIWSLSLDKIAISTHLVIDSSLTASQALAAATDLLKSCYNFFEVTIQVEEYREDMKDCEHCLNDEVVIDIPNNIEQKPSINIDERSNQ